jgi:uncharacterized protein with HEPN domain
MRNRVVHDYGNVDFEIVWETVQSHLPLLFKELQQFFAARGDALTATPGRKIYRRIGETGV